MLQTNWMNITFITEEIYRSIGSSGVVHNFDFFISAKKNQKEKFINAISNPNNSMIIKSKITDAMQEKEAGKMSLFLF
ncbi:DUF1829 domain-containing protein [Staphylococcus aureus]